MLNEWKLALASRLGQILRYSTGSCRSRAWRIVTRAIRRKRCVCCSFTVPPPYLTISASYESFRRAVAILQTCAAVMDNVAVCGLDSSRHARCCLHTRSELFGIVCLVSPHGQKQGTYAFISCSDVLRSRASENEHVYTSCKLGCPRGR